MATKKIEDVLREAAAAVDAAGLPDDLRGAAFTKAVDLIAGTQAPSAAEATGVPKPETKKTTSDALEMIASRFGIDLDFVDEAFAIEDDVPSLAVGRTKLANSDKGATEQIALLVAAARQAAGVEDWTESSVLREAAANYNRFDKNNLAYTVSSLEDDFSFSGKGQARRVKVRRDGFKNAGTLVKQILGKNDE